MTAWMVRPPQMSFAGMGFVYNLPREAAYAKYPRKAWVLIKYDHLGEVNVKISFKKRRCL